MKSQILHTVWCDITGESAGIFEIDHSWEWKGQWNSDLTFLYTLVYIYSVLIELAPDMIGPDHVCYPADIFYGEQINYALECANWQRPSKQPRSSFAQFHLLARAGRPKSLGTANPSSQTALDPGFSHTPSQPSLSEQDGGHLGAASGWRLFRQISFPYSVTRCCWVNIMPVSSTWRTAMKMAKIRARSSWKKTRFVDTCGTSPEALTLSLKQAGSSFQGKFSVFFISPHSQYCPKSNHFAATTILYIHVVVRESSNLVSLFSLPEQGYKSSNCILISRLRRQNLMIYPSTK